jgi:hypothetical protein
MKDLVGFENGRLKVIRLSENKCGRAYKWVCLCSCGKQFEAIGTNISCGSTSSCGCYREELRKELTKTHGEAGTETKTVEYETWIRMKARCYDTTNSRHKHYASKGISVCEEWRNDYAAFLAYVGRRPSLKHSLDRIDNDGNYEPGNVRWATKKQQTINRNVTIYLTYLDRTLTLEEWSVEVNIPVVTLSRRYHRGWSVEQVLFSPYYPRPNKRNANSNRNIGFSS